jgi:general secretion pathway protein L
LVALAPAALARLVFGEPAGSTERQIAAVARSAALEDSVAAPQTLHAVSTVQLLKEGEGRERRRTVTAVVANSAMLEWLEWLKGHGANPEAIVPAGLLLPHSERWMAATVGAEAIAGRGDLVFPHEPALTAALARVEDVEELTSAEIERRIALLADWPPLNLRTGPFACRRLLLLDWARVRELAALAATVPLIGLLVMLVMILRLNADSDRLDAEAAALASRALGRPVTIETARTEVEARLAQGGGSDSPFTPVAALYQQLQMTPGAAASTLSWQANGTLAASLAAPRAEELNRILIALQGAGYKVTAVPRQGPDGRAVADVTVRSRP